MIVLGIGGRTREASAALVIDGRLVAAVAEASLTRVPHIGYRATGGLPVAAIGWCLEHAGLTPASVDLVAVEGHRARDPATLRATSTLVGSPGAAIALAHGMRRARVVGVASIDARTAVARHFADDPAAAVLAVEAGPMAQACLTTAPGTSSGRGVHLAGFGHVDRIATTLAIALGLGPDDAWTRLDALARRGAVPAFIDGALASAIGWQPDAGFLADDVAVRELLDRCRQESPAPLDEPSSHIDAEGFRRGLASAFLDRVARVLDNVVDGVTDRQPEAVLGAGSLMASQGLVSRLGRVEPGVLQEATGLGVGAALAVSPDPLEPNGLGLGLGPSFDEPAMKAALEAARLDYVYEPDWQRLRRRASAMIAAGKLVGWFQGPLEIGSQALGARSILASPANRYTRDNINHYLRRGALDTPLAISLPEAASATALGSSVRSPFGARRVALRTAARDWCRHVVDGDGTVPVHTLSAGAGSNELLELLNTHAERTGVPGLVHVPLCAPDEPTACSPRDALRTFNSTPIDALVMGRFLVMKDYWLLRSTLA